MAPPSTAHPISARYLPSRQSAETALKQESQAKAAADQALAELKLEKQQTTDLLYATRINLAHREWQAGIAHRARHRHKEATRIILGHANFPADT
jgi:hypothetical protein